jgi:galactose mutarotase-like enzyme
MEYILENEEVRAVISTMAAEVHSFRRKDKPFEYMWNGDPKYWSGRNPILFPEVGSPKDKIVIFRGKEYTMGNHGFARHSEFVMTEKTEDTLHLELAENESTLAQYPYRFRLEVVYRLRGNHLQTEYVITNRSEDRMPFGFGLHPAFNCPIDPDKKLEDYRLEFNADENDEQIHNRKIELNRPMFREHLIKPVTSPASSQVSLTDGVNSVTVDTAGYKILMFWSPEDAPFVCIEPWMNSVPKDTPHIPFAQIKGIRLLDPGASEKYYCGYTIV